MSLLFFVLLVFVMGLVVRTVLRHRSSLISARGFGVSADIGRLNDVPRVRIRSVTMIAPEQTELVVVSSPTVTRPGAVDDSIEVEFMIELDENDSGFVLLRDWLEERAELGIVVPPEGKIVRLRSISDMQPLTLRLVDP